MIIIIHELTAGMRPESENLLQRLVAGTDVRPAIDLLMPGHLVAMGGTAARTLSVAVGGTAARTLLVAVGGTNARTLLVAVGGTAARALLITMGGTDKTLFDTKTVALKLFEFIRFPLPNH